MFYEDILPTYLSIGVDYDRVLEGTPKSLKPYLIAYEKQKALRDEELWVLGAYIQNAVMVAVDHCLNGRKARSEYLKEPFSRKEKSVKDKRKEFMARLMNMKTEFELGKR